MSDLAIQVENLSKAYQLGDFSTGALTRDIERWWALMRGKEDPFLRVGEVNDRSVKGTSDIVWSLKDINFEIREGDAVGVIGRNGAGKSTLLKLLSRVTSPTTGNIKVKGRIASLLEVGTGFHPELTGGENIYLNGAIMGMNKREIKRKFDEIVDFAGVERYIDTPVKRYSSGMYVRLAFAVAAYLDAEILVVDEVLAVGDAEFQKKCLGKMNDVSKGQGRTVLFVSHNMDSVRELTNNAILLAHGQMMMFSDTTQVIEKYIHSGSDYSGKLVYGPDDFEIYRFDHLFREIRFQKISLINTSTTIYEYGSPIDFEIEFEENTGRSYKNLVLAFRIMSLDDKAIATGFSKPCININSNGKSIVKFRINELLMAPGKYCFGFWIGEGDYTNYGRDFDAIGKSCFIEVIPKTGAGISPVWYHQAWGNVILENLTQII